MKRFIPAVKPLIIVAAILTVIILTIRVAGIQLSSVQSGSMEPNIPTYSICVINTKVDINNVKIGDILVYKSQNGEHIIHRVIKNTKDGFVMQGDANPVPDKETVTSENLVGRMLMHIPYLAHISNFMQSPFGIVVIIALILLNIIPFTRKNNNNYPTETKSDT